MRLIDVDIPQIRLKKQQQPEQQLQGVSNPLVVGTTATPPVSTVDPKT